MEIIKRLIETHRLNSNGSKDIAVLTPYTAQKKMLMKELEKSKDVRVRNVAVSSIIESQGEIIVYMLYRGVGRIFKRAN